MPKTTLNTAPAPPVPRTRQEPTGRQQARRTRVAGDVARLLNAAGAPDHQYREIRHSEQRRAAASRWRLLEATDRALARQRNLHGSAEPFDDPGTTS